MYFLLNTDMDPTIEDIAGMYSSIGDEPVPPVSAPLATRPSRSCSSTCHSCPDPPASVQAHPTGGDVQGEAGSRLRIAHANFYKMCFLIK